MNLGTFELVSFGGSNKEFGGSLVEWGWDGKGGFAGGTPFCRPLVCGEPYPALKVNSTFETTLRSPFPYSKGKDRSFSCSFLWTLPPAPQV